MDELIRIREALEYYHRFFGVDPAALAAVEAMEALTRLESRVLPTLPAGWLFHHVTYRGPAWCFCMHEETTARWVTGQGLTPRAAILAAFAQLTG